MGQVKSFNDIIADYLKQRAEEDTLFAPKFANPNKSIDECCRYILGEARKRGTAVAMSDSEVFGLAVHYTLRGLPELSDVLQSSATENNSKEICQELQVLQIIYQGGKEMTKIKLNWAYAKGEFDTDTLKLICIPARGKRVLGPDELDAELCIKNGMNYQIAEIHLGDVESSNVLCNEIARRWNEFNSRTNINSVWHDAREIIVKMGYVLVEFKTKRGVSYNIWKIANVDVVSYWNTFITENKIIRYAYIEDLLPNTEE